MHLTMISWVLLLTLGGTGAYSKLCMTLASFSGSRAWTEEKDPDTYCLSMPSSPRISDFKTIRMSLIGSITLQSSLSADKQKLTIHWSTCSMQGTKGTQHMREQCIPGSLSSSPAQESLGARLVWLAVTVHKLLVWHIMYMYLLVHELVEWPLIL